MCTHLNHLVIRKYVVLQWLLNLHQVVLTLITLRFAFAWGGTEAITILFSEKYANGRTRFTKTTKTISDVCEYMSKLSD